MRSELSVDKNIIKLDKLVEVHTKGYNLILIYEHRKRPVTIDFESDTAVARAFDKVIDPFVKEEKKK